MAPRSALANISFTVDSASEDEMTYDELNALPTLDTNIENKAPGRKARGTTTQSKASVPATKAPTRGRPATRRAGDDSAPETKKSNATAAKKAPAKPGRKAATGGKGAAESDAEELEDSDDDTAEPAQPPKPAKRGRPPKAKKVQEEEVAVEEAPVKKTRKTSAKETAANTGTKAKTTAKSKATKRATKDEHEHEHEHEPETHTIPETQPEFVVDEMDLEDSIEVEDTQESMPPPPRPSARQTQKQSSRTQQPSDATRRAGNTSDSERDPVVWRKVGELTKKLDSMTARFETLKEAATFGKESNFEQLKARTEQRSKDQDAVIKALKQQVSALQSRTSDLTAMKKEIAQLSRENTRLVNENEKLTESLESAQKESSALSTKLSAARASASSDNKAVPGSAMKARTGGVVLPGTAEAARDAQLQKQKVEMYCDLTNLVVVGIKKNEDEEEVYDCLQTGRNGTLHFHLTVAEGTDSYEDTEFIYQPLLDEQRDRDLLDLLPDYLTEEISFPRGQAAKFYCKVVDSMSKKIILEDEE